MPDFHEMYGYPRGRWERGHFYGARRIFYNWEDTFDILQYLDANPSWPYNQMGPPDSYIRRADVRPFCKQTNEVGAQLADYQYGYMDLYYSTYGPILYQGTNWVEEEMVPITRYVSLEPTYFTWEDGTSLQPGDQVNHITGGYAYRATFHRLLALPAWVLTRPGAVNLAPFATMLLGIVFNSDTLLYQGARIQRYFRPGFIPYYTLIAEFLYHPETWHRVWRPTTMRYEHVYVNGKIAYLQPRVAM